MMHVLRLNMGCMIEPGSQRKLELELKQVTDKVFARKDNVPIDYKETNFNQITK